MYLGFDHNDFCKVQAEYAEVRIHTVNPLVFFRRLQLKACYSVQSPPESVVYLRGTKKSPGLFPRLPGLEGSPDEVMMG